MKIYNSIDEFNLIKENLSNLVYVPTMGNLHYGHAALIDAAKRFDQEVIATIYINKLQFNDKNDYLNYPKTLDKDLELLKQHGCNHLILPDDSILDNIKTIKASTSKEDTVFIFMRKHHSKMVKIFFLCFKFSKFKSHVNNISYLTYRVCHYFSPI